MRATDVNHRLTGIAFAAKRLAFSADTQILLANFVVWEAGSTGEAGFHGPRPAFKQLQTGNSTLT